MGEDDDDRVRCWEGMCGAFLMRDYVLALHFAEALIARGPNPIAQAIHDESAGWLDGIMEIDEANDRLGEPEEIEREGESFATDRALCGFNVAKAGESGFCPRKTNVDPEEVVWPDRKSM